MVDFSCRTTNFSYLNRCRLARWITQITFRNLKCNYNGTQPKLMSARGPCVVGVVNPHAPGLLVKNLYLSCFSSAGTMSSSGKKRVVQSMQDVDMDSSSDDSSGDESDYKGNEQVQVEFEGRIPTDSDSDGIKQLLKQLFCKARINLSDLTELIIKQNYVGSVVKQCDDDPDSDDDDDMVDNDVYGITTVINLTEKRSMECVKQIHTLLKEGSKHGDDRAVSKLNQVLDDQSNAVGLLINERFINIPPQISVPLLMNLSKETEKAKSRKMPFDFKYYIIICKLHKLDQSKKKPKKNKNKAPEPEIIWSNAEEEVFEEVADVKFDFAVASDSNSALSGQWRSSDAELIPWRRVLIFPASKLDEAINKVSGMLEQ